MASSSPSCRMSRPVTKVLPERPSKSTKAAPNRRAPSRSSSGSTPVTTPRMSLALKICSLSTPRAYRSAPPAWLIPRWEADVGARLFADRWDAVSVSGPECDPREWSEHPLPRVTRSPEQRWREPRVHRQLLVRCACCPGGAGSLPSPSERMCGRRARHRDQKPRAPRHRKAARALPSSPRTQR